jgi:hypothetical protein
MVGVSLQGNPAFSTTKTGRLYIAEILLKVTLSTINENRFATCQKLKKHFHPELFDDSE